MWRCLRQKKNATAAKATAAIPPTTPPTIGPTLELPGWEEELVVVLGWEEKLAVVPGWKEELVVVPLMVVDAQCVNVLLFHAEISAVNLSFVYVLQNALEDRGFPKRKEPTKT